MAYVNVFMAYDRIRILDLARVRDHFGGDQPQVSSNEQREL